MTCVLVKLSQGLRTSPWTIIPDVNPQLYLKPASCIEMLPTCRILVQQHEACPYSGFLGNCYFAPKRVTPPRVLIIVASSSNVFLRWELQLPLHYQGSLPCFFDWVLFSASTTDGKVVWLMKSSRRK